MNNPWQGAADWLRNNYQDHANVASLCDAMLSAAPVSGQIASIEDDAEFLRLMRVWDKDDCPGSWDAVIDYIVRWADSRPRSEEVSEQGASEEIQLLRSHLEDAKELLQKMMKQEAEPYGYVWFNHHMEHRFTRGLPLSCHNATDIKPIFERPPIDSRPRSEDSRVKVEDLRQMTAKANEYRDKLTESEESRMELLRLLNEETSGSTFMGEPVVPLCLDVSAMVNRFLGWPLPKSFAPDCGISFDGRKDDEFNKNKSWPIGTNLLTADEATEMFRHCLASTPPKADK